MTGGSKGIGREVVRLLAAKGRSVAFTYRRDEDAARQLERECKSARSIPMDLVDPSQANDIADQVESEMGAIIGLVTSAGTQSEGLLAMTSDEQWHEAIDTNLGGAFRLCRAVLPRMVSRRQGSIVLVSSLAAVRGLPGMTAYSAAKAGLLGMTRSLAREVGSRGIRVNAVLPGFVATTMTAHLDEQRVRQLRAPECLPDGVSARQVAQVISFLLFSDSSAITGQALRVDAGASA